jgi:hypothetical protein
LVVFVCRDDDSAREFCRAADPVVTACHSYAGEYPGQWGYAGREREDREPERRRKERAPARERS